MSSTCADSLLLVQILFAICHNKGPLTELEKQNGRPIFVSSSAAGEVSWSAAADSDLATKNGDSSKGSQNLSMQIPEWCGKWVVTMDEFTDGVVGAKSKNLAGNAPVLSHFDCVAFPGCLRCYIKAWQSNQRPLKTYLPVTTSPGHTENLILQEGDNLPVEIRSLCKAFTCVARHSLHPRRLMFSYSAQDWGVSFQMRFCYRPLSPYHSAHLRRHWLSLKIKYLARLLRLQFATYQIPMPSRTCRK